MMEAQELLDHLPPPGNPVTIAQLAKALSRANNRIVCAIDALRRRGLVERLETGTYRLTRAGAAFRDQGMQIKSGPKGPHTGRAKKPAPFREAAWRVLRIGEAMTVQEIIALLPAETCGPGSTSNLQKYLKQLSGAGYLVELGQREPGSAPGSNGFKRWRLLPLMNTGPKTPYWSPKERRLVDPNVVEGDDHD